MQKYHTNYLDFYGIDQYDVVDELKMTQSDRLDFHHIDARGMGGRKSMDAPWNIQVLSTKDHADLGDKKHIKPFLKFQKFKFMVWFLIDKLLGGDYDQALKAINEIKDKAEVHPYAKIHYLH